MRGRSDIEITPLSAFSLPLKMEQQKVDFCTEISQMMFGFGDSPKPNAETVQLIDSIVLKQLRTIVQEALKHCDGKNLKGKEIIFLMRRNTQKMRRFVQYLKNKQIKAALQSTNSNIIEIDQDPKPKDELMEFIESIDETGEFTDLSQLDEVKQQRMLRADRISQALNETKYLEFCKARTASFARNDLSTVRDKFRLWIDPKKEIDFHKNALMILSYLAHQTVAEIVDYAFLVRMDGKSNTDPLNHLYGSFYTSTIFNTMDQSKCDYAQIYTNQPPISVGEVKEVMRRLQTPQGGKLNFGGKLPETHYIFAL